MDKDIKMPRQKLSWSEKNKKWRQECVDAIDDSYSIQSNYDLRIGLSEKIINQNLYEGVIDTEDMAKYLNPYGIVGNSIDKGLGHHAILVPKIDVLVGEAANRHIEFEAIVTNPDSISSKLESKREMVMQSLMQMIQEKYQGDDEQVKAKLNEELSKLNKFVKYSWKDTKELRANRLLSYFKRKDNFNKIFTDGFKDALILGEEIYKIDIYGNYPRLTKLNPMTVYTVRSGNSSRIEDSDIIVIEEYWSPGRIIDTFHEQLKKEDIDRIFGGDDDINDDDGFAESFIIGNNAGKPNEIIDSTQGIIELAEINGHKFTSDLIDTDGNIRVLRVFWRSLRKIKKVKYYDDDASTLYKYMSEEYLPDATRGEEATTIWLTEFWEGTKIGKDIYISLQPTKTQYTSINNPTIPNIGIVGELYNTNQGKVVSLVSRMKSYQYLYDAIWDRLNKAIAKNLGRIVELDVAKIPQGWDVGKWMHYATTMGIGIVDSFKEGNKGAAMGKLAGGFNTTGKVIDAETGSYIQSHISMLEYIKQEMSEIAGISKQREGNISNRETVGGVERSVMQSSHITEWWFLKHDDVVQRALTSFLEIAKIALKGNKAMMQNLLDDKTMEIFEIDGDEYAESDYDVLIVSNENNSSLRQNIQQLAQAAMQNQMVNFSDMLYIFNSKSINDIRRRIESSEDQKNEAASQQQQQEQKNQEQALATQKEAIQFDRDIKAKELELKVAEMETNRLKSERDYNLKVLELEVSEDIDMSKIELDIEKAEKALEVQKAELQELIRSNKANEEISRKKQVSNKK